MGTLECRCGGGGGGRLTVKADLDLGKGCGGRGGLGTVTPEKNHKKIRIIKMFFTHSTR